MILREPGSPQPGSCLVFLVRIQTVDPSAFEMPDTPVNKTGFFIFQGGSREVRIGNSHSSLGRILTSGHLIYLIWLNAIPVTFVTLAINKIHRGSSPHQQRGVSCFRFYLRF